MTRAPYVQVEQDRTSWDPTLSALLKQQEVSLGTDRHEGVSNGKECTDVEADGFWKQTKL